MRSLYTTLTTIAFSAWVSLSVAFEPRSTTVSTAGSAAASGTGMTNICVLGGSCGLTRAVNANSGVQAYGGLAGRLVLRPQVDSDQDGRPDEEEFDNDGDGLHDDCELVGDAFSPVSPTQPNLADSDGDGASDLQEAQAGTDPANPTIFFGFASFDRDTVTLTWPARQDQSYLIFKSLTLANPNWVQVAEVPTDPGYGPWLVTTNSWTDPFGLAFSAFYYKITIKP